MMAKFTWMLLLLLSAPAAVPAQFPKTDPASAFAELKVATPDGFRLRQPKEDWEGARRRVASDPAWANWLATKRSEVDSWMEKRQDKVEWVAGWWHDFVSPKDGSFLTWTPEEPGPRTLGSPSDPQVQLTPAILGGWVFGFRSRHASKIEEAAELYRLTGEVRYAEWAAAQLDFYAQHFEEWPLQTQHNPARLTHQSLDEAVNLHRYVRAARVLGDFVDSSRRQAWIAKLFGPEAELLNRSMQRIHNIACWQRSAQAMVALYAQDADLWKLAVDGPWGIKAQVAQGITSDYLWIEQSLLYNNYVASALMPFFVEAALAGRISDLTKEALTVGNLLLAPVYLRFPDGKLPTPADSTGGFAHAPNRNALAAAYRIFPTALGLETALGQRNNATLIDPPESPGVVTLPPVTSRHLESSRMAVLRKGSWQVYFHYGQLDSSHAQAEALNYEAYWDGIDVTHDPGTVGYGSPMHKGFYTTGWAHNVPLIDGLGQERWQPGQALIWDAERGRVSAVQPQYRKDVRVERELRIDGAAVIDRVQVTTVGEASRKIGLVLHLQGEVELPPAFLKAPPPTMWWESTRAAQFAGPVTLPVTIRGVRFQLTLRGPAAYKVVHGTTPDQPPGMRQSLYWETSGRQVEFVTELVPEASQR